MFFRSLGEMVQAGFDSAKVCFLFGRVQNETSTTKTSSEQGKTSSSHLAH